MNQPAQDAPTWNIANQVTVARLIASVLLFVAMHHEHYLLSIVLFLLGAATDWLDGYLARSRNLVTQLGRILDPLADKIIICGAFIFLSAIPESGVPAWMTVIVVVRELVVTVIRSFLEKAGHDFSAQMPGKVKMVLQCVVVVASLLFLQLSATDNNGVFSRQHVWFLALAMTGVTLWSGLLYIFAAIRLLGGSNTSTGSTST